MDPHWEQESWELSQLREYGEQDTELSYLRKFPSKWRAAVHASCLDPLDTVRIIDHFVIPQQDRPIPGGGHISHDP